MELADGQKRRVNLDLDQVEEELSATGKKEENGWSRSIRRAKSRVREIALANEFQWFVTFTLDQKKIDRYDMAVITPKLNDWLRNQVRRRQLRYVLIPERHKDGAIHFHGFMSWDGVAPVAPSGTYTLSGWKKPRKPRSAAQAERWVQEGAREVFNVTGWKFGFSTAIAVYGDYGAAVGYVCKYVTKQVDSGKIGGRWYYSGGALRSPGVAYYNFSVEEVAAMDGAFCVDLEGCGSVLAVWRGSLADFHECFAVARKKVRGI